MKSISRISILLLTLSFILQSCGSLKETTKSVTNNNISGNWSLKSLNEQSVKVLFEGQIPSMNIDQTQSLISGNGGCNNFSGQFTLKKSVFEAPNLIKTLMMCTSKNAESELMQALSGKSKVYIKDGLLYFEKDSKVVAQFERGIDNALLSGEWILKSMDGHSVTNLFAESVPTLNFLTVDKNISGFAGCNQYNANYDLSGYTIKVGAVMSTRMACAYSANEMKFIQAISDESQIILNGDTLSLSKNNKIVLEFVRK